jgi:hypothetical protein
MVIKRVGPVSCAKLVGAIYAVIGLCFGAVMSLVAVLGGMAGASGESAAFGAVFGVAAIIVIPLLYGGLGFVTTLIGAWLYNVFAGMVGGVEMELEPQAPHLP